MKPATETIRHRLLTWYRREKRDLPWRRTRDPYRIWVSEVMLQQTQVDTVIPYYHRFLSAFPDPATLADAPQAAVLKLWEGLGYYARARHLHRAMGIVMARHGGRIPDEWDAFRALPGVGDYIAAAVLSIAFGRPYAVVDGNVKRVLARLLCIDLPVNVPKHHADFRQHADHLLDHAAPSAFNQALMEIGALICRPAGPRCNGCPLMGHCCAFTRRQVDAYPRKQARAKVPRHPMAIAVMRRRGKLLLTQRPEKGLLGGLWEFPNARRIDAETPEAACRRLAREQLGLQITPRMTVTRVRHAYTHFQVQAEVLLCDAPRGRVRLDGPSAFRWVAPPDLDGFALPKLVHKLLPALFTALKSTPA
ncbi:MAG: A/G-specific adenine glycosylase [Desulfosarcinaceae bacterium]|nr:A/G-specific adenine glycosylase [Desulfosarcinaceae bacterium]